jgi:spore cortex formation protein SpoVR/YcgB (stage V sporulation)
MLEFLKNHANVVAPPAFDSRAYGGLNAYALGYAKFADLGRICEAPDAEERAWFPQLAGGDWQATLDFAMRNFKDESFIAQCLSPRLIREFHLFAPRITKTRMRSWRTAFTTNAAIVGCASCSRSSARRKSGFRTSRSSAMTATGRCLCAIRCIATAR